MPDYQEDFLPGVPEWIKEVLRANDQPSPTSLHNDPLPVSSAGVHLHHWEEIEEPRDDGLLTAICYDCGVGIHFHPSVHSVSNGTLT